MSNTEAKKNSLSKEYRNTEHIRYMVLIGGMVIMLVAQFMVNPALTSSGAATADYLVKLLVSVVSVALISAPATLAMVSGHIDLSVGSILMLSATISCTIIGGPESSGNTAWAIIAPLLVGVACGVFNGFLIGVLKLGAFITTLGTMYLYLGVGVLYNGGTNVNVVNVPAIYDFIGSGTILGVPFSIIMMILTFLVFGFVLHRTNLGRRVYAVGGNSTAAKYSGIKGGAIILSLYGLIGLLSGYAGLFVSAWTKTADNTMGTGREFNVIMAMILGGAQMSGGAGSVFGTALGVLFVGVLERLYVQFDIAIMYQWMIKGFLLVAVVFVNSYLEKLNASRGRA